MSPDSRAADGARDQAGLEALLDALENVPLPSVAAVHGGALGGGFELALTCDMIVAADTAFFGMAESTLGLLPLLGGVQRVVQRAGLARAKEMAMFGRRHDPVALERWGIINLVTAGVRIADCVDVMGAATGGRSYGRTQRASRRSPICRRATASRARMRSRPKPTT